ncbi:MAG TPA: hypothetical protein VKB96_11050 [Gammaproteobacteria bacterium]|nr:hypothetical protein [Gammaproteobacteria bacterium]
MIAHHKTKLDGGAELRVSKELLASMTAEDRKDLLEREKEHHQNLWPDKQAARNMFRPVEVKQDYPK